MSREQSLAAFVESTEKAADGIIEQFAPFTDGSRVLLLLRRHKEGGHSNEHSRRRAREVIHDRDQLKKALVKLLFLKALYPKSDYRIYMSACPRDLRKAELLFKQTALAADSAEGDNKRFFYENVEEKWISALMASNPLKDRGVFMLDVDTPDNSEQLIWCSKNQVDVLFQYRTKNGWHIIVPPFNVTTYPKELGEVKKDPLILLAW